MSPNSTAGKGGDVGVPGDYADYVMDIDDNQYGKQAPEDEDMLSRCYTRHKLGQCPVFWYTFFSLTLHILTSVLHPTPLILPLLLLIDITYRKKFPLCVRCHVHCHVCRQVCDVCSLPPGERRFRDESIRVWELESWWRRIPWRTPVIFIYIPAQLRVFTR
jgi:hypothetical protein